MAQKKRTPTQEKKHYKALGRLSFAGEFVTLFTPYIAIGIVNYNKYFIQYNGTKISIGFAMAMVVLGITTWLYSKQKIKSGVLTLFIGFGLATGILFLIEEILKDLCYIMLFGWIGLGGTLGLDFAQKKCAVKVEIIDEAIKKKKIEMVANEYEQELEEKEKKKVRIKIKD